MKIIAKNNFHIANEFGQFNEGTIKKSWSHEKLY